MMKIVMNKYVLLSVAMLVCSNVLSQSEKNGHFYVKIGADYTHGYKINNSLNVSGFREVPPVAFVAMLGMQYNWNALHASLEFGGATMNKKTTKTLNGLIDVSLGYNLSLPNGNSLIFSGVIGYENINVTTGSGKDGEWNWNKVLNGGQSNVSSVQQFRLHQLMVGPRVTWQNSLLAVSAGYDVGCVPMNWFSNYYEMANGQKERLNRLYVTLLVNIGAF